MTQVPRSRNEKGIAIIIALLALLILSTLAASAALLTRTGVWNSLNFTMLTQARYASEAGWQKTMNWMIYNYTPPASISDFDTTKSPVRYLDSPVVLSGIDGVPSNYPDSAVSDAFAAALGEQTLGGLGTPASFSASATLMSMKSVLQVDGTPALVQIWRVTSQGNLSAANGAQVETTAIMETPTLPAVNFAAFGTDTVCNTVNLSGNAFTDSFDSSVGTYDATQQETDGDIGSNGNISLNGNSTTVKGTVSTPLTGIGTGNCGTPVTALNVTGGAAYTGGLKKLPEKLTFLDPSVTNFLAPAPNQNGNSCADFGPGCSASGNGVTLAPGLYGNVSVGNGKKLHLTAGTYVFNRIDLSANNTEIVIDSGPITLKLAGQALGSAPAFNMGGNTAISNVSSHPKDLIVVYGGTGSIELTGGASTYAVVYAPNAVINANGGSDWYGALIGKRVNASGGIGIHYDRSLATDVSTVGSIRPVSFSWNKY